MRRKHVTIIGVGIVTSIVIGGVVFGYWTVGGAGTGAAATGTATNLVVHQTSSATGLHPGGSAALAGNFDNPNGGAVTISAVTASVHAFTSQTDTGKPACTQADFSITGTSNVPGSIAAGNGVGAWSGLTLNMLNTGANQDNCKSLGSIQIDYSAA